MWSTPMLLSGQELGEGWQLSFRRSDHLRSRFAADDRGALIDFYASMIRARKDPRNRALKSRNWQPLPTRDGSYEPRIYVAAKWSDDGNVVFVAHNLWQQNVAQSYYLPQDLAQSLALDQGRSYRLVDAISGAQLGDCRRGADLAWNFYVALGAATRMQWMRLETCP